MKRTTILRVTLTALLLASACLLGGCGDKKNKEPIDTTTTTVTTTAETDDTADTTTADVEEGELPLMGGKETDGSKDGSDHKEAKDAATTTTTAKNGPKSDSKDNQQGGMIQTEDGEVILTIAPPKQTEPATLPNSDKQDSAATDKNSETESKATTAKAQEQTEEFKLSTNEDGAIVLPFVPFE